MPYMMNGGAQVEVCLCVCVIDGAAHSGLGGDSSVL
jgi:hypothetical protein